MDKIDCVVIGGGVVGLAITKKICESGLSCVVVDSQDSYGKGISSRNSEVIHAGIYYPKNSLKARLCLRGKELLYSYCKTKNISHNRCGKIIVASSSEDENKLKNISELASSNGVDDLIFLSKKEVNKIEPLIECSSGLFSPSTGIIDSHDFMTNLIGDIESLKGFFVPKSPVKSIKSYDSGYKVIFDNNGSEYCLHSKFVINTGGLSAQSIAKNIDGFPKDLIPDLYLCKGTYFSLSGVQPFTHLIYPAPPKRGDGLGIHSTIDMNGNVKFGPDVEYVDYEDYSVDEYKIEKFYSAISRYFPSLKKSNLKPDYCGLRPKLQGPNDKPKDFEIQDCSNIGFPGLINLFGIESPGLTSSLAIAEYVNDLIKFSD
tara:strand:+ start:12811 stop:13929 length:1119 start_codon:yes stop_codon:yes gene_type:complete